MQSGEAMRKLMELGVKKARLVLNNQERELNIDEIKIGEEFYKEVEIDPLQKEKSIEDKYEIFSKGQSIW